MIDGFDSLHNKFRVEQFGHRVVFAARGQPAEAVLGMLKRGADGCECRGESRVLPLTAWHGLY
jgi:hypothetical protein